EVRGWGLICSMCKRNTTRLREHLTTTCMKGFSEQEIQMAMDASTIQMQRISRNFVLGMDDFEQMGGTKNLAKQLQERGFLFSSHSESDANVGKFKRGGRDVILQFHMDKRFLCDPNLLEKVLGGTAVPEKQTKNCVPLATKDCITFEETRYAGHCFQASHSIGMLKTNPKNQNMENVCKQKDVQAREENEEDSTSREHSSENDVIFLTEDSRDLDHAMLKQSSITGKNMQESNLGTLHNDIIVDNNGSKDKDNSCLNEDVHLGDIDEDGDEALKGKGQTDEVIPIDKIATNNSDFHDDIIVDNKGSKDKDNSCLNEDVHLGDIDEDGDEALKGKGQTDEVIPIDKITTNKSDLCSTKFFSNQTRSSEYVNAESKADFGTWNLRSQTKNDMEDGMCWIGQRKGSEQNENMQTSMSTTTKISHVDRLVRTRHVHHCGSSLQVRKCKTPNSSTARSLRSIDICSDQSQEDDLIFLKMELKDPVVMVEKFGDEVISKRKRIKLEPMECDDNVHSKRFQMDSIRFERELVNKTSYKKERRKNDDKWLVENRGKEDMKCKKHLDSKQIDYGSDGQKQINDKAKLSKLEKMTRHRKCFDFHQHANMQTLNMPSQNDKEDVVFLGMRLNDPFIALGDIGKNTNNDQNHRFQRKKVKLESTLENTAMETSETIQLDSPSQTVDEFAISSTKCGKYNERTREGVKQNCCLKATIAGITDERPVSMKNCENPGEIIHEALIPNAAHGVEYKANFSCLARKRMSQKGLYKLHDVDKGILKDFYIYLLKERGNRTTHCAQITRSVGKILFYLNPVKVDLQALTNKTKLVKLYKELKNILKPSSITIYIKAIYVFLQFLETMTDLTVQMNFNTTKSTLQNLKHLNTRGVQMEMANRHFKMTFQNHPRMDILVNQLHFAKKLMNQEIMKAKSKKNFNLSKINTFFYIMFAFQHFQRKCMFENLTIEEWNKRQRHTTDTDGTRVVLAIRNHKTLSTKLAMIALSEEEEQMMKDYLNFVRPKSCKKEFFVTSSGNKIRDASNLLTCYQKMYKLQRITGTKARQILETNTWNMQDIERRSICEYLCHSTKVAEKYYRLKTPQSCVYARKVVQKLIDATPNGCS
ncbi:hypothetical protein ACJMK2_007936, partial [Sinanodonta woodiana]